MKEIKLTKGFVALVDDEDYERINQFKWCASISSRSKKYYAKRRKQKGDSDKYKSQQISMHYQVLDISPQEMPPGHVIDHVNSNTLDCRKVIEGKVQLEIVTAEINAQRARERKLKNLESEISL